MLHFFCVYRLILFWFGLHGLVLVLFFLVLLTRSLLSSLFLPSSSLDLKLVLLIQKLVQRFPKPWTDYHASVTMKGLVPSVYYNLWKIEHVEDIRRRRMLSQWRQAKCGVVLTNLIPVNLASKLFINCVHCTEDSVNITHCGR